MAATTHPTSIPVQNTPVSGMPSQWATKNVQNAPSSEIHLTHRPNLP